MANDYTQFSQTIDRLTDEEKEWLEDMLTPPEGCDPDNDPWYEERGLDAYDDYITEDWPAFGWRITDHLWVYAEESGNVDQVAVLFSMFLAKFRPEEEIELSWASSCSKLRPQHFSGGSFLAHAKGIEWSSPPAIPTRGRFKKVDPNKCEFEGPFECTGCGGHIMLDATYLDQVDDKEVKCPYCGTTNSVEE